MRIGALILCRYNSSRLPGKILKEINGVSVLEKILNRMSQIESLESIVCTSKEPSDDVIVEFCEKHNVPYYRGSLNNVAERFLNAASQFDLDYAFRINGDNLFVNIELVSEMKKVALENKYDFISNVPGRSYPYGMSIELVRTTFFRDLLPQLDSKEFQEHVTLFLYKNEDLGDRKYFRNTEHPELSGLNLAIDTVEDFRRAEKIVTLLDEKENNYTFDDLTAVIRHLKD